MLLLLLIAIFALVVFFTAIQTMYLENMRLRTRDLPSLQYFKSEIESMLDMKPETAVLTFSLWKNLCLAAFTVVATLRAMAGSPPMWWVVGEALLVSWVGMV